MTAVVAAASARLDPIPDTAMTHRVVRVTPPGARNPAEVSVAINPTNPPNVIVTTYERGPKDGPRVTNRLYVTDDAGRTWQGFAAANPEKRVQGDDAVVFDGEGRAFHSYISFDGIRVQRPTRAVNGVFLRRSDDGGRTWAAAEAVVDHRNTVTPFEDKPWPGVDRVTRSPHRGNIYLAWTRFDEYGSTDPGCQTEIHFSRSTDEGRTFAMPVRISDDPGDCLDSDNTVEGAVPAVGPHGQVYVAWSGPKGLMFDRSLDGGVTFAQDRQVAITPGGWDIDIPGIARSNGMPVTAADVSDGPRRGTIYVNWIDERNGDPDVFLASSADGGDTWTAPVRVNDDPVKNGAAQFFTWMAVDPIDGAINVVFHDRRGLKATETRVTLARSVDGGKTFVNHAVDLAPFVCDESVSFGDYNGIDAYNGRVIAVFPHFIEEKVLAVSAAIFDFGRQVD
ncbi:MAG: glycosyl hydrolase [Luteitalea sp.]|nr:glycosyl hydrolase [Luteitalea sp.]